MQPKLRVCHPLNTCGNTWLRESDLVFVKERPFAVLEWSHGHSGDIPDVWLELKGDLLKHDRPDDVVYRYEGEVDAPRQWLKGVT